MDKQALPLEVSPVAEPEVDPGIAALRRAAEVGRARHMELLKQQDLGSNDETALWFWLADHFESMSINFEVMNKHGHPHGPFPGATSQIVHAAEAMVRVIERLRELGVAVLTPESELPYGEDDD